MACPAGRSSITSRIERLLATAAAICVLAGQPALAQSSVAEPELEALIPDAALADPEKWAGQAAPEPPRDGPGTSPPVVNDETAPGPDSPLTETAASLPWPDALEPLAEQAGLEPDPDLREALAQADAEDSVRPLRVGGQESRLSPRLSLTWPPDAATFPERSEFERRFAELSAIEALTGKGDGGLAQLAVRARSDSALLQRLLRIYGFYDADVFQTVRANGDGGGIATDADSDRASVRFDLVPGVRYRFGAIDLGDLATATMDYLALRAAFGIASGDPVSADRIVSERAALDVALGENGYAFAKLGEADLLIDHRREEGDLTLPVAPGGKYRFGAIVSGRERFLSSRHLQDIARFDPGDPYKRSEIDDLRRAILATGLVSSVTLSARETRAAAPGEIGEVAIDVALEKAPLRTWAGAVGYESGEGPRAEASWEHRNMFPSEGMLRVRAIAGTREQLAGVTLRYNNFKGRDRVLTFDIFANAVQRDAYNARILAFSGSYERLTTLLFQKPWVWSAGLELLASSERERAIDRIIPPRSRYLTAALPLRAAYDASDDLLDPRRGFRAALRLSPELSRRGGQMHSYVRAQADASAYQPVSESVVLAGRVRLGSIAGVSLDSLAPSRRFFAGGGGSVRGYGYQQIGPRDTAGDPGGGRSLAEFSLEARVETGLFGGGLSVVPFVDAGAVEDRSLPRLRDLRFGAGLGIRYKTSFGPIRVDLGTPLNRRKGDGRIAVYVALGQAF